MSTCPDCRYCAPQQHGVVRQGWPRPVRWFDQPCVHCSHRLRAHDPGVPGAVGASDLQATAAVGSQPVAP